MYVQPIFVLIAAYIWMVCVQFAYMVITGWHSFSWTWHLCLEIPISISKFYAKYLFHVSIHVHQELKNTIACGRNNNKIQNNQFVDYLSCFC
jgi:hypothetical protein